MVTRKTVPRRELILALGPIVPEEGSLVVLAREIRGDVAEESAPVVRVQVRLVDDRVVVTIDKTEDSPEVLVRA